eukprot:TRINITY_DN4290_c0_g1_i1.p1 TRINITY_DN4290_c0_g1~~TRINITY_DN4290_c0_g1_i1.p1  ORF type:complete len:596 (+),score=159.79 TRINITY_DN4290_c0_g1_i1:59-1789(+)
MSEIPLSDPQIQLGRRLAATEKKTREKALKLVESFVSKSTSLTELDLMKLWKALYYCIWMQDRPVIQHELAQRLARMIHLISEDRAVLFLRAFWQTMLREWNGIDKHRLDKFYALMRYFLNETFALVKSNHWSKDLTQTVMQVLQEFPLNPSPTVAKAGVQFHVLDIVIEELEKIEPHFITKLSHDVLAAIFEPVFHLMAHADEKSALKRISTTVIESLIFALESAAAESDELKQKAGDAGQFLGERLVAHASAAETRDGNRTNLWDTRKAVMKAINRPTKRKRGNDDDGAEDSEEPQAAEKIQNGKQEAPATKSNKKQKQKEVEIAPESEESWQSGESVDSNDAATLEALVNGGNDNDESSEDDDYNVEDDDDKGEWDDHVIHDDDDEEDDEDDDEDDDDDEPIFLPPSAKHRKLLVSVHVMKALQRLGTGGAPNDDDEDDDDDDDMDTDNMHYFMNDDAKRDEEDEDEEDDDGDLSTDDDVPPPSAPVVHTPTTPPVPKKPATSPGSGRRVQFDMSRVHVQEFDKHESPATVQSPRPRNGPARPILKQSPGQSPSSVAAKQNDKSKMKSVQRKL